MEVVGDNIKKQLTKCMDWWVAIMVVHTMKKIVDAIKLNREIVEKWML